MSGDSPSAPFSSQSPPLRVMSAPPIERHGWRLFNFYSCALLLTGLVSMLFADLLWRTGWSASRTVLLVLFVILFLFIAIGCIHGLYGFALRMFGDDRCITRLKEYRGQSIAGISTARTPIPIGAFVVATVAAPAEVCAPEAVNWSSNAWSGRTDIPGAMSRA